MRCRLLINPSSGGAKRPGVLDLLNRTARLAGVPVQAVDGAESFAREARISVDAGIDRLIVAGGDGTVQVVLPALAGGPCALGVVPLGRGNDLARGLGVPLDPQAALAVALGEHTRTLDLGECEGRLFAGVAGVGFDGDVAAWVRRHGLGRLGAAVYPVAVLRTLSTFHPMRVRATWDDGAFDGEATLVLAANLAAYGGGMRVAPGAQPNDGYLDVVLVRAMSRARLLALFPRVYRGSHVRHPAVQVARARHLEVTVAEPRIAWADGEPVNAVPAVSFSFGVRPQAVRVAAPPS